MTGAELDRKTFWKNEFKKVDKASKKLVDEIIELCMQLQSIPRVYCDDSKYWRVWLKEERGTYSQFIKENRNRREEYTKEAFYERYPNKECWFEFRLIYEPARFNYLALNSLRIILDEREVENDDSYEYDLTPVLAWVKNALVSVIEELKQGTYNDRLNRELPYTLRYGVLRRDQYWKVVSEEKKKILGDLTQDDIKEFLNIVEKEGDEYIPEERIKGMTFNKYFQFAYYGYEAANFTKLGESPVETFLAKGEDFGGSVFRDIDFDSVEAFDGYYENQLGYYGGHPWGMLMGSSRTRIMFHPVYSGDGYYFWLGGNPTYMIFEIVRFYLGLKRNNVPVLLSNARACIEYLREEDLVGVVKETEIPVYCEDRFQGYKVHDFRHFHEDEYPQLKAMIEWLPLRKLELI